MRTMVYRDDQGEAVWLAVPWGDHSGNIPPPSVTFWCQGADRVFKYTGETIEMRFE